MSQNNITPTWFGSAVNVGLVFGGIALGKAAGPAIGLSDKGVILFSLALAFSGACVAEKLIGRH